MHAMSCLTFMAYIYGKHGMRRRGAGRGGRVAVGEARGRGRGGATRAGRSSTFIEGSHTLPQVIHSYTLYKARTHYIKPRQRYPKTSMRGRLKIALAPDCTSAVVKSRGLVLKTSFRAGNRAKPLGRSSSFSYSKTKTTSSTLSSLGVGRQRAGRGLWVGRGNHPKHATPHQSHGHSADSTNADTPI